MNAISQSNFLQALGWAVINSLWQMALLWVVCQLILSFLPTKKAGKKAGLATWLVIIGFGWFIYTFISSILFKKEFGSVYTLSGWIGETARLNIIQKTLSVASVFYLLILAIPVWKFIRNYKYVRLIRQKGLNKINVDWRIFVKNMAAGMGISRPVQIWLSELIDTPVTIGFIKPIILIPFAAINNLSTQQVEAILLHELSHIRRFDYLFNLIINFIKTILYFNPFVRLFVKRIESERENSCDEMVVQFQYQPHEYASALLQLEKTVFQHHQMMIAASGKEHDLQHRVESILGIRKTNPYSFRQLAFSLATMFSIIVINIFLSVGSQQRTTHIFTFNNEINPYYYFNSKNNQKSNTNNPGLFAATDNKKKSKDGNAISTLNNKQDFQNEVTAPAIYNVGFTTPVIPELPINEEEKVKQTLDATKKILEEKEWKELEKSYAEVFNSAEKTNLKNEYRKELNNVDWKNLENQLRLSYNNINWDKVNNQLINSLAQIKMDSINHVVDLTLGNLGKLETWMKENKTNSIPDTDITLQQVKDNEQKIKAQLEKIKKTRNRKIVRI